MEETVILNFEVDQSKALKDLQKTEKAILNLKEEQADLNKEYKAGKISQEEYVRQNIKLQSAIKKENDQKRVLNKALETESNSRNAMRHRVADLTREYNNLNLATEKGIKRADELQKEIKQLNDTLNQGSKAAGNFKDNIGQYPDAFGSAIENINVAGVSIGDLGAKLTGLINPATAVAGIITGLGFAYANSAAGAEDFRKAQNGVTAALDVFFNSVGNISDNEIGFAEKASIRFNQLTAAIFSNTKAQRDDKEERQAIAKIELETLQELEVETIKSAANAKKREKEAEIARRTRDNDQLTFNERIEAAEKVTESLTGLQKEQVRVLNSQIRALLSYGENVGSIIEGTLREYDATGKINDANIKSLETKKVILSIAQEIADKEEEVTGKLTENVTATQNLLKAQNELLKTERDRARINRRLSTREEGALVGGPGVSDVPLVQPKSSQEAAIEAQQQFANILLKVNKDYYDADVRNKKAAALLKDQIEQQQLQNTAMFLAQGASLFDENTAAFKIFASSSTLISTWSSAQKAYEAAFLPVPTVASPALGAAYAATAIASGLANVARINGVEFAEGGFTGAGGKYEPAGIVHRGEYVVPQEVNYSPAAQPHIAALESMRMNGYADGGFVASQNIASSQQALMTANMLKNMPAPEVSVKEITKTQRRVQARENLARQQR